MAHIIFNGLQGFIILTIFTMNGRVLKLYKERFRKVAKKFGKKGDKAGKVCSPARSRTNICF